MDGPLIEIQNDMANRALLGNVHLGVLNEGRDEGGVVERSFPLGRVNGVAEVIPAAEVLPGSWKGKGEKADVVFPKVTQ